MRNSSILTIKSMFALFVGIAFLFVGNGLIVSSAGVELKKMGADELETGFVISSYFIGAMIATVLSHRIVSRVGHIRSFGIFASLLGIAVMFHALSQNLYFWTFLRCCLGFCHYSILVIVESWLNSRARNEVRSRVLAFYEIVFYIAFGFGILIMGLSLSTLEVFLISAAFILISGIPLNLIHIKQPPIPEKKSISLPKIFTLVPLALVCGVIAGILMNGFFSMASIYILSQNYSPKEASYFMSIAMIGGFIAHCLVGSFSDKFGRRPAIILCCLISLIASGLFLVFNLNIYVQYLLSFFIGAGVFCLYALALARANDEIRQKSDSIEVGRAILFCYSVGSFLSSIVIGAAMKVFGSNGFMIVNVVLLAILAIYAMIEKTVPVEYRKDFQHSPGTMANISDEK
ncbi:MAG: MFS transporter [Campylobacter sp.]